jgi:DNA polymerase
MTLHRKESLQERILRIGRELERHVDLQKMLGTEFLPVPKIDMPVQFLQENLREQKLQLIDELHREALQCSRCVLADTRTNLVFGSGSPDAQLMFIGEAPGYHEDQQGIPFIGRAGQLLTKIIQAIGLSREEVYIANILKCRPPQNRDPSFEETINCYPYLLRQIEIIKPKIIVALGGVAAKKLLKTDSPIGRLRGEFLDFQGTKLIVTYHPAYLLRNPVEKRKTWEDMKKVRDYLGLKPAGRE